MNRKTYYVLIVDDDQGSRETLSEILQSQGYSVTTAATANESVEKARTQVFDLILLDIKLPDREGTQVLAHFQKIVPEALKIMITGYPSIQNTMEALNIGADAYFTKPFKPEDLLKTIENKLQERERRERTTGKRLEDWVRLQIRRTQSSEYEEFANKAAIELCIFGVNKTQAKIYVALTVLGAASASEVASLTKIRREEVYRMMPELERKGMVTSKLGTPRRFVAIEPKIALENLASKRMKALEEEAIKLGRKKAELVVQLENTMFRIDEENSIESLSEQRNVQMRLMQLTQKAKRQIDVATLSEDLEAPFLKHITKIITSNLEVKVRMIIDGFEAREEEQEIDDACELKLLHLPQLTTSKIEMRQVNVLPFNLLLVDDLEAVWGDFQSKNAQPKVLWTNDSAQVDILKRAFQNLWQEAQQLKK
jgi:CheY-like chemotaxis protein